MLAEGLVWVAELGGEPIGFAACQLFLDALHLWELAVRRDRQGQGAGRALVEAVVAEARQRDVAAVTLTTFRDLPWNGPFYARCGFSMLGGEALNGRLTAILLRERRRGLDVDARCAMRLSL